MNTDSKSNDNAAVEVMSKVIEGIAVMGRLEIQDIAAKQTFDHLIKAIMDNPVILTAIYEAQVKDFYGCIQNSEGKPLYAYVGFIEPPKGLNVEVVGKYDSFEAAATAAMAEFYRRNSEVSLKIIQEAPPAPLSSYDVYEIVLKSLKAYGVEPDSFETYKQYEYEATWFPESILRGKADPESLRAALNAVSEERPNQIEAVTVRWAAIREPDKVAVIRVLMADNPSQEISSDDLYLRLSKAMNDIGMIPALFEIVLPYDYWIEWFTTSTFDFEEIKAACEALVNRYPNQLESCKVIIDKSAAKTPGRFSAFISFQVKQKDADAAPEIKTALPDTVTVGEFLTGKYNQGMGERFLLLYEGRPVYEAIERDRYINIYSRNSDDEADLLGRVQADQELIVLDLEKPEQLRQMCHEKLASLPQAALLSILKDMYADAKFYRDRDEYMKKKGMTP